MKPLVLFVLFYQLSFAQTLNEFLTLDFRLEKGREELVREILDSLEMGKFMSIQTHFKNIDSIQYKDLETIQTNVYRIKWATKRATTLIQTEEYNIYKTQYCNNTGEVFEINFMYHKGYRENKVALFSFKSFDRLDAERQGRIDKTKLPPPPEGWND